VASSGAAPRRRATPGDAPERDAKHLRARTVPSDSRALDTLIHHRMRLGIVSALAANESLTFNELKELMRTTDGNLSVHARKLEEAQYLTCIKRFEGRRPRTEYRLTASGRRALQRYLDHMESLIQTMRDTLDR
jgi:DNA-binding MarR family transcriptional regulator